MVTRLRHKGFSLIEVMISAGILAIGFVLIAGAFPVGAKLTAIATERTIGLATSEEAFAKIRLYGIDFTSTNWPIDPIVFPAQEHPRSIRFSYVANYDYVGNYGINLDLDPANFATTDLYDAALAEASDQYNYPSTNLVKDKKYRWSAFCRYLGGNQLQVTVFVCRLTGLGAVYPKVDDDGDDGILGGIIGALDDYALTGATTAYPVAIRMIRDTSTLLVPSDYTDNIINIDVDNPVIPVSLNIAEYIKYVTEGCTLLDGRTGLRMYVTAVEVVKDPGTGDIISGKITLLNDVNETLTAPNRLGNYFWVIPPSVNPAPNMSVSGRYPCVEVYQRVITF